MDPTIKKIHESGTKYKFKIWLNKVTRTFWYVLLTVVLIQAGLIAYKLVAPAPHERMCWDESICFNYCELAKQKRCIEPDRHDANTLNEKWALFLIGKRNIVEILSEHQSYCACDISVGEETRLETSYQYYWDNR